MIAYAPTSPLSLESIWMQTFWQYITASIQSGKAYLPHEQNNIAVNAVHLADSASHAYKERFGEAAPQSGGGATPQASQQSEALFTALDAIDTPQTPSPVATQLDAALKAFQAANNQAQKLKPSPSRKP